MTENVENLFFSWHLLIEIFVKPIGHFKICDIKEKILKQSFFLGVVKVIFESFQNVVDKLIIGESFHCWLCYEQFNLTNQYL